MFAILAFATNPTTRTCGTMDVLQQQLANDPSMADRMQQIENQTSAFIAAHKNQSNTMQSIVTIPVVFHVVYATSAQNISDAQCQAQLNQLNLDYARLNADASSTPSAFASLGANTQIQFCMAVRDPNGNATTGVIHKSTTVSSFSSNDNVKRSANGGDDAWDATKYLNIWSCNLGGGLLGYAQFPGGAASTDGVVFLYSSIGSVAQPGTASPYNLGRTATHEVGHWLNLRHINGDGNCASDLVNDTPTQSALNFGCPAYPHVTCSNGPNGDMFMNYMDYTDDGCMNIFTAGQAARMQALFTTGGARVGLLTSQGCVPVTGGTCNVPSGLSTTGITTTTATLNWGAVSGAVSYNLQYRIVGAGSWTSTTSTTTSKSLSNLVASTNYEWQVQTVCSTGSSAFSGSSTFTTSSTGGGGCSDIYEPNESRTAAKTVSTNTHITGLISTTTDKDYFKFTTTSPNTNVKIDLTNLAGDYDVKLLSSSGSTLATSQNGGTTAEQIKRNTTSAATYYVYIYGYQGANSSTVCYDLLISTSSTAWRESADAINEPVAAENNMIVYPNPTDGIVNVSFNGASNSTATVRITDMVGRIITSRNVTVTEGNNKVSFDMTQYSKGVYLVELSNESSHSVQRLMLDK